MQACSTGVCLTWTSPEAAAPGSQTCFLVHLCFHHAMSGGAVRTEKVVHEALELCQPLQSSRRHQPPPSSGAGGGGVVPWPHFHLSPSVISDVDGAKNLQTPSARTQCPLTLVFGRASRSSSKARSPSPGHCTMLSLPAHSVSPSPPPPIQLLPLRYWFLS